MKIKLVAMASIFLGGAMLHGAMENGRTLKPEAVEKPRIQALSQLPMTFEAADEAGVFTARGVGYRLALSANAAAFRFSGGEMQVRLAGGNSSAKLSAGALAPGEANYFLGSDPSKWRRRISQFRQVECASVYPGIDVVYRGTQRQLEYDFIVEPGADPNQICLEFSNAARIELDDKGNLVAHADGGDFCHHRPVVYQEIDGKRQWIDAKFVLTPQSAGQAPAVKFQIGAYDAAKELVIDPVLSFSTFLGGSGDDQAFGVAVDRSGSAYVAGQTASLDFPSVKPFRNTLLGGYDVFIAKYNPAGTALEYSTYIGGNGVDRAFCLATDAEGNAVLAGVTFSTNFPSVSAFQPAFGGGDRDGFVMKLNSAGNEILFSTYLGGSGSDELASVAVDSHGNLSVGGHTSSTNFPVFNAYQSANRGKFDAVVAKFDPKGVLAFSTYLGGSGPYDCVVGIATDSADNILATGYTSSPDFPTARPIQAKPSGGYDAFVSKFSPKGTELLFSTWLGGTADDVGRSIAVDKTGAVYVSGDTFSTNFPMVKAVQKAAAGKRDVFVAKLNLKVPEISYSTYFGGSGEELASLAVDAAGSVHLIGLTTSRDLPLAKPIQAVFGGGEWDAFIAKLNPAGSGLDFSSYLGGSGNDQGAAIALDDSGNIYIAGATASANFTTREPVQSKYGGGAYDAFVAKIMPDAVKPAVKEVVETEVKPAAASTVAAAQPAESKQPEVVPAQAPATAPKETAVPAPVQQTNIIAKAAAEPVKTEPVQAEPAKAAAEPAKAEPAPVAGASGLPLFGTNLIVNGGAEAGAAAVSSYKIAPVPGWVSTNGFTVLRYGTAGGFPDTNSAAASGLGRNFFAGGPDNEESSAAQTIDVASAATQIDNQKVQFKCSAYLGGMGGQNDNACVQLVFKDGDGAVIKEALLGPVTLAERQYKTKLILKNLSGPVPAKTRSIGVTVRMKRVQGAYNDAFADEIQLQLMESAANR